MSPKARSASTATVIRTNLEVFVLAAVRAGLDSAYDLNRYADLSVGATLPLLARLEAAGLLSSKAAARKSKQYSLTPEGRFVLQRSWRSLLASVPREFEAILRVAYMAAVVDTTLEATRQFLKSAAADRKRLADQRRDERKAIERETTQLQFGRGHRWLRAYSDSARLQAEAALLSRLATQKDLADVLLAGNP